MCTTWLPGAYKCREMAQRSIKLTVLATCFKFPVEDLGKFQGHRTPLLASVMIESYGSLTFNETQLFS